jgi:ribosome maturation factor RimP
VKTEADTPVLARVRALVTPIVADLGLEIYDLELRGGVLRLTLDTPAGAGGGVTLDLLALGSRLVSKELDAHDPIPSRYTLEVTSPGVERSLRTPAHFQREIGKDVALRLHHVESDQRRVKGRLVAADDDAVTVQVDGEPTTIAYAQIDRARTVFEWGPQPKPGSAGARRRAAADSARADAASDGPERDRPDSDDLDSDDLDSDETENT